MSPVERVRAVRVMRVRGGRSVRGRVVRAVDMRGRVRTVAVRRHHVRRVRVYGGLTGCHRRGALVTAVLPRVGVARVCGWGEGLRGVRRAWGKGASVC